jgi:hypothetical protein
MEQTADNNRPDQTGLDLKRVLTHEMPIYERPDGSRSQVLGGSILASEGASKTDFVDLGTGEHRREEPAGLYTGAKQVL